MNDVERSKLGSITSLTTLDVPQEYWDAAFLLGNIPLRALKSDSRISYALYVPPDHYTNPKPGQKKLPLLVSVHATRRNLSTAFDALIPFANSTPCAVLAPLFPAGLDAPNDLNSYQILKSVTLRSDLCLLNMLDEVSHVWPGIETSKVFLMGFSGGAQFTHRFMYLYPERLMAVSIGAPGGVTMLDESQSWPKGVKNTQELFGKTVQKGLIGKLPIQLVVGGADNTLRGGPGLILWLLKQKAQREGLIKGETHQQSMPPEREKSRVDNIPYLKESWKQDGIEARLDVVDGVQHRSDGVRAVVMDFMVPLIQKWYQTGD